MTYLLFFVGFLFLIKGADLLVDGASSIAKKFGVSSLVIGLTVVAFGTSLPEFVVSALASFNGNNELAISNVVGSNTANILLVLGVAGVVSTLKVENSTIFKEIPFSVLAMLLLVILTQDKILGSLEAESLSRGDGLVLLLVFLIFLYYTFSIAKNGKEEDGDEVKELKTYTSIFYILIGVVGLSLGGKWIVDGAVQIASSFGMSEALIGATIVAIGTSLPELAASGMAAYKGQTGMAVGNVVGSNIFNVLWVLGANAALSQIPYSSRLDLDSAFAILATVLLFIFIFIGKKHQLCRWQAIVFLLLYGGYIFFAVSRG